MANYGDNLVIEFKRPFHDGERMWPQDRADVKKPIVMPINFDKTLPRDAVVHNDPRGVYKDRGAPKPPVNENVMTREMRLVRDIADQIAGANAELMERQIAANERLAAVLERLVAPTPAPEKPKG